jgi:hypothetical protein
MMPALMYHLVDRVRHPGCAEFQPAVAQIGGNRLRVEGRQRLGNGRPIIPQSALCLWR